MWGPPWDDMWWCRSCWHPAPAEEYEYRRLFEFPEVPYLTCSVCKQLPPVDTMIAAQFRLEHLARQRAEAKAEAVRIGAKASKQLDIPRREAYPIREAATLIGISESKLKEELRDHRIAFLRVGKRRFLARKEIE